MNDISFDRVAGGAAGPMGIFLTVAVLERGPLLRVDHRVGGAGVERHRDPMTTDVALRRTVGP